MSEDNLANLVVGDWYKLTDTKTGINIDAEKEDKLDEIANEINAKLQADINKIILTIRNDVLFLKLLQDKFKDDESENCPSPQDAQLVPIHSSFQSVYKALEQQAEALHQELNLTKEHVFFGLIHLVRKKLKSVESTHCIRVNLTETATQKPDRKFITPEKLKEKIIELSKTSETDQEKIIKLLKDLQVIPINFDQNKEKTLDTMRDCTERAQTLFTDMIYTLNKILTKNAARNGRTVTLAQFDQSVKSLTIFNMLTELFIEGKSREPISIAKIRRLNDIQVILYLAYKLFEWELNPLHEKALEHKKAFVEAVTPEGIKTTAKFNILKYNQGTEKFETTGATNEINATEVQIQDGESIKVAEDGVGIKAPISITEKLTSEYPERQYEDLNDHLRGRIILCDINTSQLNEPATRLKVTRYITILSKKLNLRFNAEKNASELGENECTVEWPDSQNLNAFSKVTLQGRLNGVKIEIQLIPKDLHETSHAIDSPLDHSVYKLLDKLNRAKILIPESMVPELHEIINEEIASIKLLRAGGKKAAIDYQKQFSNTSTPSNPLSRILAWTSTLTTPLLRLFTRKS